MTAGEYKYLVVPFPLVGLDWELQIWPHGFHKQEPYVDRETVDVMSVYMSLVLEMKSQTSQGFGVILLVINMKKEGAHLVPPVYAHGNTIVTSEYSLPHERILNPVFCDDFGNSMIQVEIRCFTCRK